MIVLSVENTNILFWTTYQRRITYDKIFMIIKDLYKKYLYDLHDGIKFQHTAVRLYKYL